MPPPTMVTFTGDGDDAGGDEGAGADAATSSAEDAEATRGRPRAAPRGMRARSDRKGGGARSGPDPDGACASDIAREEVVTIGLA